MELKQYLNAIKKWWWLMLVAMLLAAISSYFVVSRMPRIYQASTTLIVGQGIYDPNPNSQDLYISQQLAQTYREMVTRQPILGGAAEMLGLSYVPGAQNVAAWLVPGTQLMGIAVRDTDPERARALADAIAQQLILQTPNEIAEDQARQSFVNTQLINLEQNIQTTEDKINEEQAKLSAANSAIAIQKSQNNIASLQQKLASDQATYASLLGSAQGRTNYISVFEPASTPSSPISPQVKQTVLLAAAMGLVLAAAGALLIEFLDDTLKTPEDVKQATDLPTLGTIMRIKTKNGAPKLITVEDPLSITAEAYRSVRTSIRVSSVDKPITTLVVTSPNQSEGKTTTIANLGVVMAQTGKSVILVDTDLRRSALHKVFQLPNDEGLTTILFEDEPVLDGWVQKTEIENLRVLTSGPLPPNPSELLDSLKMQNLIERLKSEADIVIFDSPPALLVTDASVLAMATDGVLLITDRGRTRRKAAQQAVNRLQRLGANLLGVVLNRAPLQHSNHYYYYQPRKPRRKQE
jgi:succinoglycan biosynthesis transport protein ExoP